MKLLLLLSLVCSFAWADLFHGHGLGLKKPADWAQKAKFLEFTSSVELPAHFDWREKLGKQPPILDQGGCGSCWAFSRVSTISWQLLIHKDVNVTPAPQELVSCDNQESGCGGGYWDDYETGGISEASAFPYVGRNVRCKSGLPREYKASWQFVGSQGNSPSKDEVKQAIFQYGPVGVTVNAVGNFPSGCGGNWGTNHMVVLTGWDDSKGGWYLQNSWGTDWEDNGYAVIKYGCYNVAEEAAVATLE